MRHLVVALAYCRIRRVALFDSLACSYFAYWHSFQMRRRYFRVAADHQPQVAQHLLHLLHPVHLPHPLHQWNDMDFRERQLIQFVVDKSRRRPAVDEARKDELQNLGALNLVEDLTLADEDPRYRQLDPLVGLRCHQVEVLKKRMDYCQDGQKVVVELLVVECRKDYFPDEVLVVAELKSVME